MASPEIEAYLDARADFEAVLPASSGGDPDKYAELASAHARMMAALQECVPPGQPTLLPFQVLTDTWVWRPLLVDEFDGDTSVAEIAWELGQRPPGYPVESR